MIITVNGEKKDVAAGATVLDLLTGMGLNNKTMIVQRNDDIVERSTYASTVLFEGDALELVRMVGGG